MHRTTGDDMESLLSKLTTMIIDERTASTGRQQRRRAAVEEARSVFTLNIVSALSQIKSALEAQGFSASWDKLRTDKVIQDTDEGLEAGLIVSHRQAQADLSYTIYALISRVGDQQFVRRAESVGQGQDHRAFPQPPTQTEIVADFTAVFRDHLATVLP